MKLGLLINLHQDTDIDLKIKEVKDMGFDSIQLTCWDMACYTDEWAEKILAALEKHGFTISTIWCGWSGKHILKRVYNQFFRHINRCYGCHDAVYRGE